MNASEPSPDREDAPARDASRAPWSATVPRGHRTRSSKWRTRALRRSVSPSRALEGVEDNHSELLLLRAARRAAQGAEVRDGDKCIARVELHRRHPSREDLAAPTPSPSPASAVCRGDALGLVPGVAEVNPEEARARGHEDDERRRTRRPRRGWSSRGRAPVGGLRAAGSRNRRTARRRTRSRPTRGRARRGRLPCS